VLLADSWRLRYGDRHIGVKQGGRVASGVDKNAQDLGSLSQEALDRLIYVIGMARGGTSVLRDAIAIHPRVLALPGMTHFMNQVWRYRHTVHLRLLKQIFRLPEFYREEEVIQSLDEEKGRALRGAIDDALNSRDLKRMWPIYPLVYALDRQNEKAIGEVSCWLDKANDFYGVEEVARSFPESKFVLILRDPRGAVSSLAKRAAIKETYRLEAPADDAGVAEAAISWRRMTQQMLRFKKNHPSRSLLVRFEDFVGAPNQTLNAIFQFIGNMALPEDLLDSGAKQLAYGTTHMPGKQGTGVKQEPVERWRKMLGDEQVKLIEGLTGKTALKAGYPVGGRGSVEAIRTILKVVPGSKRKARNIAKIAYLQAYETLI
jgi:hypothetical protein